MECHDHELPEGTRVITEKEVQFQEGKMYNNLLTSNAIISVIYFHHINRKISRKIIKIQLTTLINYMD